MLFVVQPGSVQSLLLYSPGPKLKPKLGKRHREREEEGVAEGGGVLVRVEF